MNDLTSIKACSLRFFVYVIMEVDLELGQQASSWNTNAANEDTEENKEERKSQLKKIMTWHLFFKKVFEKFDFSWYVSVGYELCFIISFSHHQILPILS